MRTALLLLALTATAHAQWDLQTSNTTASLRGIHSLGNGVAWASGSEGTVLHTTDNGTHWLRCATPPDAEKLDFRGVQAFDASTAIVMTSGKGDLSRLYKTTDACQTWKLAFTNPDKEGFWDAIRFMPASPRGYKIQRAGVLVGDPVSGRFRIFVSYDLGTTWEQITKRVLQKEPKSREGESLFAASNTAADAVGDAGNLAFVTGGEGGCRYFHLIPGGLVLDYFDSAASFEQSVLRCPHASSAQGAFSMTHRQLDEPRFDTMIVGGDYLHPEAGGYSAYLPAESYSWFVRHQPVVYSITPPHGYRSAVTYDAATKTWITVGPNGTDVSTDDGRNWRALKPLPGEAADADQHWNALSLPFVVGPHGRIGVLNPQALKAR